MVEPLFSITSTRAEMCLVLCELSPSHRSMDVYAHMFRKCKLTLLPPEPTMRKVMKYHPNYRNCGLDHPQVRALVRALVRFVLYFNLVSFIS
jgi:hypothetical protein